MLPPNSGLFQLLFIATLSSGQRLTFLVSIVVRVEGYSGQSYVGIVIIAEL